MFCARLSTPASCKYKYAFERITVRMCGVFDVRRSGGLD